MELLYSIGLHNKQADLIYAINAAKRTACVYVFHEKDVYIYDHKRIICEYLFILFIIYLPSIIYHLSITSIFSGYWWTGRMREVGGGKRLYGWMEACMACVIDG
jgi:hypothetical protein